MSSLSQLEPVAFEIDVKVNSSPARSPAVKRRLEEASSHEAAPPTLENIEQKLQRALALREEHARRTCLNTDVRVTRVQERKSHLVKEQAVKIRFELDTKFVSAKQLRGQALDATVMKARNQGRLSIVQEKRTTLVKEKAHKIQTK